MAQQMQRFGELSFKEAMMLSCDTKRLVFQLQKVGALYSTRSCAQCGSEMKVAEYAHYALDGLCWRCPKKGCKRTQSLRTDSYFAKSHLSLGTCFMIVYCYMKYDKMLQKDIADIIGASEQALVDWGNYIRESISSFFIENPLVLGAQSAVQVDESLFGGKCKYHRGDHHQYQKSWVFGIVEEGTGLCVLWMVDNRKEKTLLNIIKDHVASGATVKSDLWGAYDCLGREGYDHLTVNHSLCFVSKQGVHTQMIESVWSQVKAVLKIRRGTTGGHLAGYIDFYAFICLSRFRRLTRLDAFFELIQVGHCH
jgi:hypothetical protein